MLYWLRNSRRRHRGCSRLEFSLWYEMSAVTTQRESCSTA